MNTTICKCNKEIELILIPGKRWPEEMIDGQDRKGGVIERHVDRHDEAEVEVE